tara:strand:+ start:10336 stop:11103 length:768 start_codon:yes stop_codon:yes gene_type:complete
MDNMDFEGIRDDLIAGEYKSRFNPYGGWVEFGIVQDSVEKISAKTYMLPLQKTTSKTYLSSLIYYRGSANCFFLGKISPDKDDILAEFKDISMIKVKTGWFSSIEVSHDALVCINDIGLSVKKKSDWQRVIEEKTRIQEHYQTLLKKEKKEREDRISEHRMALKKEHEDRLKALTRSFGTENALKIINGEYWKGMTKSMLTEAMGEPFDVDETVYKTKTKLKYFYKPYITRQKTRKFQFRVDIEDDIVVGWRDLD